MSSFFQKFLIIKEKNNDVKHKINTNLLNYLNTHNKLFWKF